LLANTIEYDRYPLSPRLQTLRRILAKFEPLAPAGQAANTRGARPEAASSLSITAG
jgi:hypothetical protein